jgi:hypothetical protein
VIETYTKKKLIFPSHLQLSFYADHLEAFASSNELTLGNKACVYTRQEWEAGDLPRLFSAANSIPLLQDKRLVIVLWLTNEQSNQEVIG